MPTDQLEAAAEAAAAEAAAAGEQSGLGGSSSSTTAAGTIHRQMAALEIQAALFTLPEVTQATADAADTAEGGDGFVDDTPPPPPPGVGGLQELRLAGNRCVSSSGGGVLGIWVGSGEFKRGAGWNRFEA
jgi:hypothetical protein